MPEQIDRNSCRGGFANLSKIDDKSCKPAPTFVIMPKIVRQQIDRSSCRGGFANISHIDDKSCKPAPAFGKTNK